MQLTASRFVAPLLLTSLFVLASEGHAYVLKKDSTGAIVRWQQEITFTVDEKLAERLDHPGALEAIQQTFDHLEEAAGISATLKVGRVGKAGYNFENEAANRNEISAPDVWEFESNMIAVTLVTINTRTHEIIDSDIVFNIVHRRFTVVPVAPTDTGISMKAMNYVDGDDVQNTFTHELGHALGLAHNPDLLEAVMYPGARKGETHKRQLTSDDLAGLAELYPGSLSFGLSTEENASAQGGCSASGGELAMLSLFGLFPLFLMARRHAVPVQARGTAGGHARRARAPMAFLAATLMASLPVSVSASEVVREPARAKEANIVLTGTVLETRTLAPTKGARVLVSEVVVALETCLKGPCAQRTMTLMVGGRHGDIEQRIEGLEVPKKGEVVGLTVLPVQDGRKLPRPTLYRLGEEKDLIAFARGLEQAKLPFMQLSPPSGWESGSQRLGSQR